MGLIDDNGNYNVVWDVGGDQQPGVNSTTGTGGTFTPDAFNQLTTDSSSFSFTIDSGTRNAIQWIAAKDRILIGTSGGEWRLSGHSNKPITPSNKDIKIQTVWGSKDMQPLVLHEAVLFVDFVGKKLREMVWDGIGERYLSPDLLLLAEHITKSGGITTMAYQRNPDSIIWATLANGELISCTYVREQDVVAWARHPLGTTTARAADSEVEEITYGDYTQYFVGFNEFPVSGKTPLCNATSESAIDTTWGTDGYWGNGVASLCRGAAQLSDDSLLIIHDDYTITKLDSTGTVDTTWATNGSYVHPHSMPFYKILLDDDENSYLFSWSGGIDARYTYIKLDSTGTFIHGLKRVTTKVGFINDAQWSDSTKTRIIAAGQYSRVLNGKFPNMIAIDPNEGVIDTSWPGNIGEAGYAQIIGDHPTSTIYNIRIASDGGIVCHRNNSSSLLIKVLSNGNNLDTSWGDTGHIYFDFAAFGSADQRELDNYGDELFVMSRETVSGSTRVVLSHIDENGVKIDTYTVPGSDQDTYTCLQVFNDKLILGGNADNDVEIWTQTFVKESGFDLEESTDAVLFVLLDEATREFTVDKTRVEGVGYANSVCVIPGSTEDEIWITIERVINGSIVQYIERMKVRYWGTDQEDVFFVDSGLTYDSTPTNNFTELGHLEGETVAILGDGAVFPTQVVTGGTLPENLDQTVTKAHIGLPYTYKLKPMRADQNVGGTTKGSIKNIAEAVVSFYKTGNARYGDGTDSHGIDFRTTEAYTTPPALYTGDKLVHPDAGFSAEDPFEITGSDPLPCTVRCIVPRIDITGR